MSMLDVRYATTLPPIPGPSLGRFSSACNNSLAIEYLELLSKGAHSYVFKVRINGKIYALKIVCLF
jgi:hypothetical protein